jgi:Fe-S cluster biogenesis protein NfuA
LEDKVSLENRINIILEHIKPYLKIDGGDVELIEITDDGIVKVRLKGSCYDCSLKPMTLRAGIERAIMHEIPEIKRIEEVI